MREIVESDEFMRSVSDGTKEHFRIHVQRNSSNNTVVSATKIPEKKTAFSYGMFSFGQRIFGVDIILLVIVKFFLVHRLKNIIHNSSGEVKNTFLDFILHRILH